MIKTKQKFLKVKRDNRMSNYLIRFWDRKIWPKADPFSGRVEHIQSGEFKWFHSIGELISYLEKKLK